ncbi:MAG TPA: hypothetical protein VG674_20455 [Amycolatopsis sp.]|nr:hypothetical protein [Amycolatopsis sp.]
MRAGRSRALVVHGEAGVGKTALLDYLFGSSSGCHLIRVAGGVRSGAAVRRTAPVLRSLAAAAA